MARKATQEIWMGPFFKGVIADVAGDKNALIEGGGLLFSNTGSLVTRQARAESAYLTGIKQPLCIARHASLFYQAATPFNMASVGIATGTTKFVVGRDAFATMNWADLGTLPVTLANTTSAIPKAYSVETIGQELVVPTQMPSAVDGYSSIAICPPVRWAGNTQAPLSGSGAITAAATSGSRTITGVGTSWTTAMVGQYIRISSGAMARRWYRITGVTSTTVLTIDRPAVADAAATNAWIISAIAPYGTNPGVFGNGGVDSTTPPQVPAGTGDDLVSAQALVQHAGRTVGANLIDQSSGVAAYYPHRIRWSGTAQDGAHAVYPEFSGQERWELGAYQDIYPGEGGERITALASWNNQLFVFKANGVFVVRGGMQVAGLDQGMSVEIVTLDDGCVGPRAVTVTPMGVVFAGKRGVWVIGPAGISSLTNGKIGKLYSNAMQSQEYAVCSFLPYSNRIMVLAGNAQAPSTTNYRLGFYYSIPHGAWTTLGSNMGDGVPDSVNVVSFYDNTAAVPRELTINHGNIFGGYALQGVCTNLQAEYYPGSAPSQAAWRPQYYITTHALSLARGSNVRVKAVLLEALYCASSGSGSLNVGYFDNAYDVSNLTPFYNLSASQQNTAGTITSSTATTYVTKMRVGNRVGSNLASEVRASLYKSDSSESSANIFQLEGLGVEVVRSSRRR